MNENNGNEKVRGETRGEKQGINKGFSKYIGTQRQNSKKESKS